MARESKNRVALTEIGEDIIELLGDATGRSMAGNNYLRMKVSQFVYKYQLDKVLVKRERN
jgi:hypothetical protein